MKHVMKWLWTILSVAAAVCVWGIDNLVMLHITGCIFMLSAAAQEAKQVLAIPPAERTAVEKTGGGQS